MRSNPSTLYGRMGLGESALEGHLRPFNGGTENTMIDDYFQDRVLACMQRIPQFNAVASQHLRPDYFDTADRRNLCKMMLDFWRDYGTLLTDPAFMGILGDLKVTGKIKAIEVEPHVKKWTALKTIGITDWAYILDQLLNFIKHQRIKALINEAVARHLPKNNFTAIEQEMAKIAGISVNERVAPYDYFNKDAIQQRAEARLTREGRVSISTGIKPLDDQMHAGGFTAKELYVFMAPPKRGKTMSMLWFSNQAALQGYSVAHFTCEVSKEICSMRLDSMNSRVTLREVDRLAEAVAREVTARAPRGKLMLFEHPTKTLTVGGIDQQIERLAKEDGITTNMVVVDYLDLLKLDHGTGHSGADAAAWSDQGPLAAELRGISGKYVVPVVTATQVNRGGSDKAIISARDIAGDYGKVMIADEVYAMSATKEELDEKKLRIINVASRNSEMKTVVISTAFEYGQFFNEYLGESM